MFFATNNSGRSNAVGPLHFCPPDAAYVPDDARRCSSNRVKVGDHALRADVKQVIVEDLRRDLTKDKLLYLLSVPRTSLLGFPLGDGGRRAKHGHEAKDKDNEPPRARTFGIGQERIWPREG